VKLGEELRKFPGAMLRQEIYNPNGINSPRLETTGWLKRDPATIWQHMATPVWQDFVTKTSDGEQAVEEGGALSLAPSGDLIDAGRQSCVRPAKTPKDDESLERGCDKPGRKSRLHLMNQVRTELFNLVDQLCKLHIGLLRVRSLKDRVNAFEI